MTDQTYVTADYLARKYGKSPRYFQLLAKAGKLPGATQPNGPGTPIYFVEANVEAWMTAGKLEKAKWQKSTGATAGRGRTRASKAWPSASPLTQSLREKLKNVSSNG